MNYVKKQDIDFLINNAGFENNIGFFEDNLDLQFKIIETHINAIVKLTHWIENEMIKKRREQ